MNRILLIRHGSTDLMGRVLYGRMPGVHLSAKGLREADQLAEKLQLEYKLRAVVSSPMDRALETARPVAESQLCELGVDERLTEIDVGDWMGKSFDELAGDEEWAQFNRHRSTIWAPGGESMMQVQTRGWQAIADCAQGDGGTTAFVTHGDVIRCLILLVLGVSIDHIHRVEISPASVTEIEIGHSYPVIRRMNYVY
jgi:broad specificity phosphatase PhoE